MRYIFRGHVVFNYDPKTKEVTQGTVNGKIPAFDFCNFIDEDYKLLGEFFHKAYLHTQGVNIPLDDIVVD